MRVNPDDVRYTNRDFASLSDALRSFVRAYYPDSAEDFSPESIGQIWMDTAAFVGDVLSYYTDRQFQETFIHLAEDRANVVALAQGMGYVPRLSRPASTTLEVFVTAPVVRDPASGEFMPDFEVVPDVEEGMIVGSQSRQGVRFRTTRRVDFSSDTALDPLEVSIFETSETTGEPTRYLLTKTVPAVAGGVETAVMSFGDPQPYAERVLDAPDFIDVVSVTDSDGNVWREVPFLAQDLVFDEVPNDGISDPRLSSDRSARFLLTSRRTSRRFVVRVNRDGLPVLRFGGGTSSGPDEEVVPTPTNVGNPTLDARRQLVEPLDPADFLVTSSYGSVPYDTELTVQYAAGGGTESNVPVGDLTRVLDASLSLDPSATSTPQRERAAREVQRSLAVRNPVPGTGGAGPETVEEIRLNARASLAAQDRAVTARDYEIRALNMPARYGSVAKAHASAARADGGIASNPLAVDLYVLGLDGDGRLVATGDATKQNLAEYMDRYRLLTDAVNIRDGFVINIAVDIEILVFAGYNRREVLVRALDRARSLLATERMRFQQPLVPGEYVMALSRVEGVQNVSSFEVRNLFGGDYSANVYDIRTATRNGVIYPSRDPSVFEVKYPDRDITINAR